MFKLSSIAFSKACHNQILNAYLIICLILYIKIKCIKKVYRYIVVNKNCKYDF